MTPMIETSVTHMSNEILSRSARCVRRHCDANEYFGNVKWAQ